VPSLLGTTWRTTCSCQPNTSPPASLVPDDLVFKKKKVFRCPDLYSKIQNEFARNYQKKQEGILSNRLVLCWVESRACASGVAARGERNAAALPARPSPLVAGRFLQGSRNNLPASDGEAYLNPLRLLSG